VRRGSPSRAAAQPEPRDTPPRSRLTGRSALLFVVLAVLVVSFASSARAWLDQRAHIKELQSQIAADEAAVERLTEEKTRWEDPAYVEAQARQRFGWVMPGEVGYRVIDENGEPLGATAQLSDPAVAPGDGGPAWWETAWGSVEEAGAGSGESGGDEPAKFIGPRGRSR
jgi:cell division protein FtsB